MDTVIFIRRAQEHLKAKGWNPIGFDGQWQLLQRGRERLRLPAAIVQDLIVDCTLGPLVEDYLHGHGWRRIINRYSTGALMFIQDGEGLPRPISITDALCLELEKSLLGNEPMSLRRRKSAV